MSCCDQAFARLRRRVENAKCTLNIEETCDSVGKRTRRRVVSRASCRINQPKLYDVTSRVRLYRRREIANTAKMTFAKAR